MLGLNAEHCLEHLVTKDTFKQLQNSVMTKKNTPPIEIRKAGTNEFYFVFRLPSDGIFMSIFFENILEVTAAIENFQRHSTINEYYLLNTNPHEKNNFIFKLKNKYTIGHSAMYENVSAMEADLQYMKKNLLNAELIDLTT
jgi:hypothetical protein